MTPSAVLDKIYEGMPEKPDGTESGLSHHFGAGVYARRSVVQKGGVVRMHIHGYDHLTIVASGRGTLVTDDGARPVSAGDIIEVKAGKRHAYEADEETVWFCIHGTNEDEARKLYGGKSP